jgi:hypothetical protein
MRAALSCLLLLALATCGGQSERPSAPRNVATANARITTADATATFRALAQAMDADDAVALARLADPAGGIRVWQRPGASMNIMGMLTATGGAPSVQLAKSDLNAYYIEGYRQELAAGVRGALAITDVDPANRDDAAYQVDCGGDMSPPRRATLTTHPKLSATGYPYYLEEDAKLDRDLGAVAFVLDWSSQVSVWLVERDGQLYVSDVFVDSACDA